jgi:hypothetical protein
MNRRLLTSLLALLAVLVAGVLLTSAEAAPPKKAEQDKDTVDLPPPPKSTTLAPRPKALSRSVYAGIKFLVSQQQPNGGWGSGETFGGFGFAGGPVGGVLGGRPGVPPRGKVPQQAVQTDVANTSIAGLALLRAGYTPRQGTYCVNLRKAVAYVCAEIEKSDDESLRLGKDEMPNPGVGPGVKPGGVRGGGFVMMGQTQVQRKIGNNVDPFLAALFLSESRGKMPDAKSEKRLSKALVKVLDKIQRNQKEDGTWGDRAWAPVLGQALASRALNRARQVGVAVDPEKLARTAKHARENFDKVAQTGVVRPGVGTRPVGRPGVGKPPVGGLGVGLGGGLGVLGGAAGVSLYATASGIGGMYDSLMTLRQNADNARFILTSPSVTADEKTRAKEQIKLAGDADKGFLDAIKAVATMSADPAFVRGFGSDGGEEFLSFALIGEALRAKNPKQWVTWDRSITQRLTRTQNGDGSWSGHHCITGKTFCTATALLSMMTDRASIPVAEKPKK